MAAIPVPVAKSGPKLTVVAWVVTLLLSILPDIIWIELGGGDTTSLTYAKMGLLLLLIVSSLVWTPLRPLRNFFVVMLAFFGLFQLIQRLDFTWPVLQRVFGGSIFDSRMQAEQTGKLLVSLGMIAVLLLLGLKRRDFFLTRGNLRAPIQPVRLLGFPKAEPWPSFGLQWALYIALGLGVILFLSMRPSLATLALLAPILPSILSRANAGHAGAGGRPPAGAVDVGRLLRHRPLPRHAGRHPGGHCVPLHGLDTGQGDARNAWPVLGVVDSLSERCGHLCVSGAGPAPVGRRASAAI